MKGRDESSNYLNNKRLIFSRLIDAIEAAAQQKTGKIYLKNVKIMEEDIDVMAKKESWPTVLEKARTFFESLEDYEMCHRCQNIQEKLRTKKKTT